MIHKEIIEQIIKEGELRNNHKPILYLTNYWLKIIDKGLDKIINEIPTDKKEKFKTEFILFLNGIKDVKEYNKNNIKYWNYINPKFINSYPSYYPAIKNIKDNLEPLSKNHILYLGNGKESNQQCCLSCIQFQETLDNKLILTVMQRSCDINLGFLADLYHLKLFGEYLNKPIKETTILYGNIHLYLCNLENSKKYINENKNYYEYSWKQQN